MKEQLRTVMIPSRHKRPNIPRKLQVGVFRRDRWICQYCGKPVIFAPAMKYLQLELKSSGYEELAYWRTDYDRNGAPLLDELAATIDHVNPLSEGGSGDFENLATACNRCNISKNNSKDWRSKHPRKHIKARHGEPVNWDGLSSLFLYLAPRHTDALNKVEEEWSELLRVSQS
jgi:5-methylcytosine-specific restriction endonuclease McrA